MLIVVSKFRQQSAKLEVIGSNDTIIRLEHAYKVALKYGVNNGSEHWSTVSTESTLIMYSNLNLNS